MPLKNLERYTFLLVEKRYPASSVILIPVEAVQYTKKHFLTSEKISFIERRDIFYIKGMEFMRW